MVVVVVVVVLVVVVDVVAGVISAVASTSVAGSGSDRVALKIATPATKSRAALSTPAIRCIIGTAPGRREIRFGTSPRQQARVRPADDPIDKI